jgi:alanine transaminase
MANPDLLQDSHIRQAYPADVLERAQYLLSRISGGIGAYSHSQGYQVVRESVANFIQRRDNGAEVSYDDIFLTNGGSSAVDYVLTQVVHSEKDGVLIPIPQYPLYQALLTLHGASAVGYYLDSKEDRWQVSVNSMKKAVEAVRKRGISPRLIVVINPGNPTGQVLSDENIREIIEFCRENKLMILADEVYQDNIYMEGAKFHSFRKIATEMKFPYEVFSVHSLSKGYHGECGLRGGYLDTYNVLPEVKEQILKLASISLCSNSIGQIAVDLMVNPPITGSPSHERYIQERSAIMQTLIRKSQMMYEGLNQMANTQCNKVEGAMYAFPEVKFSPKAIQAAAEANMPVDTFYVLRALEETGIILVPGSGFGQEAGTYHFRITNLVTESKVESMLKLLREFNAKFHQEYS